VKTKVYSKIISIVLTAIFLFDITIVVGANNQSVVGAKNFSPLQKKLRALRAAEARNKEKQILMLFLPKAGTDPGALETYAFASGIPFTNLDPPTRWDKVSVDNFLAPATLSPSAAQSTPDRASPAGDISDNTEGIDKAKKPWITPGFIRNLPLNKTINDINTTATMLRELQYDLWLSYGSWQSIRLLDKESITFKNRNGKVNINCFRTSQNRYGFSITLGETIIGYGWVSTNFYYNTISFRFGIDLSHRNQGYGREALAIIMAMCLQNNGVFNHMTADEKRYFRWHVFERQGDPHGYNERIKRYLARAGFDGFVFDMMPDSSLSASPAALSDSTSEQTAQSTPDRASPAALDDLAETMLKNGMDNFNPEVAKEFVSRLKEDHALIENIALIGGQSVDFILTKLEKMTEFSKREPRERLIEMSRLVLNLLIMRAVIIHSLSLDKIDSLIQELSKKGLISIETVAKDARFRLLSEKMKKAIPGKSASKYTVGLEIIARVQARLENMLKQLNSLDKDQPIKVQLSILELQNCIDASLKNIADMRSKTEFLRNITSQKKGTSPAAFLASDSKQSTPVPLAASQPGLRASASPAAVISLFNEAKMSLEAALDDLQELETEYIREKFEALRRSKPQRLASLIEKSRRDDMGRILYNCMLEYSRKSIGLVGAEPKTMQSCLEELKRSGLAEIEPFVERWTDSGSDSLEAILKGLRYVDWYNIEELLRESDPEISSDEIDQFKEYIGLRDHIAGFACELDRYAMILSAKYKQQSRSLTDKFMQATNDFDRYFTLARAQVFYTQEKHMHRGTYNFSNLRFKLKQLAGEDKSSSDLQAYQRAYENLEKAVPNIDEAKVWIETLFKLHQASLFIEDISSRADPPIRSIAGNSISSIVDDIVEAVWSIEQQRRDLAEIHQELVTKQSMFDGSVRYNRVNHVLKEDIKGIEHLLASPTSPAALLASDSKQPASEPLAASQPGPRASASPAAILEMLGAPVPDGTFEDVREAIGQMPIILPNT